MPTSQYVWDRVIVNGIAVGGSTVYWYLDSRFSGKDPWTFIVQWSHQQAGPWTNLATTTNNYYQDATRRRYGMTIDSYYRIKLTDGDGNVYYSPVASERGVWNRHDYLLAREIVRKEYLLQSKFVGRKGFLYKRYIIGTSCPVCLDYDTEQVTLSRCTTCYGTGLVGGYAHSVPLWITADNFVFGISLRDNADQTQQIILKGRVVGFPDLQTGDFWVDKNTDDRFLIKTVEVGAAIRGRPVVVNVELRLIPATDIVYSVPRDWDDTPDNDN